MNIVGAIDMLDGLEYHYAASMNIIQRLAVESLFSEQSARYRAHLVHEALAYLNRMGQFYYFADSDFVRQFIPDPDAIIPTVLLYKPFRDKHAAHRAIDQPRKEDTTQARMNYAWALSSMAGMGFSPKPAGLPANAQFPFDSRTTWLHHYFYLQLFDGQPGDPLNFSLEREHPMISAEAYGILEKLLLTP
jgi:hypothetical protein